MDKKKTQQDYIKNIYKNGESLDKSQFSKKWIELINRLENSRSVKNRQGDTLCDIINTQRFVLSKRRESDGQSSNLLPLI